MVGYDLSSSGRRRLSKDLSQDELMGGAARCCAARIFHKRNIPLVISRARFLDVDDAFDSVCVCVCVCHVGFVSDSNPVLIRHRRLLMRPIINSAGRSCRAGGMAASRRRRRWFLAICSDFFVSFRLLKRTCEQEFFYSAPIPVIIIIFLFLDF